jgi:tRNA (mo5U34)-methyltransferase
VAASNATRAADLQARVAEIGAWFHSIDLGDGVITPGAKSSAWLEAELDRLELGDLHGKSVLDIGAYDGFYSFAAERLGAERVVAFDQYIWSADMPGYMAYRDRQMAAGLPVEPVDALPEFWRPDELPGRRPFDLAHQALGSRVEVVVGDLFDYDLAELGSFDVVLYLGVLYHVRHPLLALERLAAVTRGAAYIETQAELFRGSGSRAMCRFIEGDELNHDPSNWWTFNEAALLSMCRAAGFERAEMRPQPGTARLRASALLRGSAPYRAVLRASKAGSGSTSVAA